MAKAQEKAKQEAFALPEGRVIVHHLFTKDAYDDKAVPAYRIELAFDDGDEIIELENMMYDAADAYWGSGAGDDESLVIPILDGNKLKAKREKKGKDGSSYADKKVIRMSTIYNHAGDDGPGGIQVLGPDVTPIEPARSSEVYAGCYGVAAGVMGFYETNDGDNGIKLYLQAFQKTRDGERLVTAKDRSSLFKPVGGADSGERVRRRRTR